MPFPFLAIPALVSAFASLKGMGAQHDSPAPHFFANNPEELLALMRQSTQSEFGNVNTDIRETLGDQGLFPGGAYPSAVASARIGLGQESAKAMSSFGIDQLHESQGLQSHEYLMRLEAMLNEHKANQENILSSLSTIGSGLGNILNPPKEETDPLTGLIKKKKTGKKQILTQDEVT